MSDTPDVMDLFADAAGDENLPEVSLDGLQDLGADIQGALGISAEDVPASEVFLLGLLVDDSSSIQFGSNAQNVRDGCNLILEALQKSSSGADIVVHAAALNRGTIYPFTLLGQAPRFDSKNYHPSGGTPLLERTLAMLGTIKAKEQEFRGEAVPVRSVTVIVSDGGDNDIDNDGEPHTNAASKLYDQIKPLVEDMFRSEQHLVAFMGIDDGYTDFTKIAARMGIPAEWVLTPGNDPHSIREAFMVVSRASQSASQGADSFSKVADGGLTGGL